MSKDIIVLTPNGRREKVHCSPDTNMLQVLEVVCNKQGFQATKYELKHHNHLVDLTTTLRFSNLPNKAMLELVETDRRREETNVTIGLQLEDGERRTADFPPSTSLFDLITSLAPSELNTFQQPTILYMRQEVIGVPALQGKTLRQLGLIKGRAILRLLNKAEETTQANVSAVYNRPIPGKSTDPVTDNPANQSTVVGSGDKDNNVRNADAQKMSMPKTEISNPGPSNDFKHNKVLDPVQLIKQAKQPVIKESTPAQPEEMDVVEEPVELKKPESMENDSQPTTSITSVMTQANLERRLTIEDEVTFLGAQKAVAFRQPDHAEKNFEDLPDDFYELTVEEVRKLYQQLQQNRLALENIPLIASNVRHSIVSQTSLKITGYKNVVVRVQFPDHMILQGVFRPDDTVGDVSKFIMDHLRDPAKPFHIFTTPLKETLDPKMTLAEAKFVPCVHMHFKWLGDDDGQPCLKEEIYLKETPSDAASILASKYRAPIRRKPEGSSDSSQRSAAGTSKSSKVPKWFK